MHLPLPSCQRQHCFCPSPPIFPQVVCHTFDMSSHLATASFTRLGPDPLPTPAQRLVRPASARSFARPCSVVLFRCFSAFSFVVLCFALLSCSHRKLGCVRSRLLIHPSTLTFKSLVTLRSTRCRPRRVPSPLRRPSLPRRRSGPRARSRTRYVSLPFAACSLLSIVHFR